MGLISQGLGIFMEVGAEIVRARDGDNITETVFSPLDTIGHLNM